MSKEEFSTVDGIVNGLLDVSKTLRDMAKNAKEKSLVLDGKIKELSCRKLEFDKEAIDATNLAEEILRLCGKKED